MKERRNFPPPAGCPPLNHTPAVFPVWCRGTSSACWSRGSSSGRRRSRGPAPRLSPGGPSWADSPSPWLPANGGEDQTEQTDSFSWRLLAWETFKISAFLIIPLCCDISIRRSNFNVTQLLPQGSIKFLWSHFCYFCEQLSVKHCEMSSRRKRVPLSSHSNSVISLLSLQRPAFHPALQEWICCKHFECLITLRRKTLTGVDPVTRPVAGTKMNSR